MNKTMKRLACSALSAVMLLSCSGFTSGRGFAANDRSFWERLEKEDAGYTISFDGYEYDQSWFITSYEAYDGGLITLIDYTGGEMDWNGLRPTVALRAGDAYDPLLAENAEIVELGVNHDVNFFHDDGDWSEEDIREALIGELDGAAAWFEYEELYPTAYVYTGEYDAMLGELVTERYEHTIGLYGTQDQLILYDDNVDEIKTAIDLALSRGEWLVLGVDPSALVPILVDSDGEDDGSSGGNFPEPELPPEETIPEPPAPQEENDEQDLESEPDEPDFPNDTETEPGALETEDDSYVTPDPTDEPEEDSFTFTEETEHYEYEVVNELFVETAAREHSHHSPLLVLVSYSSRPEERSSALDEIIEYISESGIEHQSFSNAYLALNGGIVQKRSLPLCAAADAPEGLLIGDLCVSDYNASYVTERGTVFTLSEENGVIMLTLESELEEDLAITADGGAAVPTPPAQSPLVEGMAQEPLLELAEAPLRDAAEGDVQIEWEVESSLRYSVDQSNYVWKIVDRNGNDSSSPDYDGEPVSAGYVEVECGDWSGQATITLTMSNGTESDAVYAISFDDIIDGTELVYEATGVSFNSGSGQITIPTGTVEGSLVITISHAAMTGSISGDDSGLRFTIEEVVTDVEEPAIEEELDSSEGAQEAAPDYIDYETA